MKRKFLKKCSFLSIWILSIISICCNSDVKVQESFHDDSLKLKFYYREIGSNNGFYTYTDYLIIENFRNDFYFVNDFVSHAINYSDSVNADLPVAGISFLVFPPGKTIPPGRTSQYHKHANYLLLSVRFSNAVVENVNVEKKINWISLWENGKSSIYKNVDSILSSKTKLYIE